MPYQECASIPGELGVNCGVYSSRMISKDHVLTVEIQFNTIIRQMERIYQLQFFSTFSSALSHIPRPSPLSTVSAKRERWSRPRGANQ